MALTKEVVIDKMEILEDGQIQVREATRYLEDGVIKSQTFHRHVVAPDLASADLDKEDARVKLVADALWTTKVKSDFVAAKEAVAEITK